MSAPATLPEVIVMLRLLAVGLHADANPVERLLERVAARDLDEAAVLRAALARIGAAAVLGQEEP